jgi:hypothetical protein
MLLCTPELVFQQILLTLTATNYCYHTRPHLLALGPPQISSGAPPQGMLQLSSGKAPRLVAESQSSAAQKPETCMHQSESGRKGHIRTQL